ncbi:hypothetical protein ACFL2T_00960 [Elusimicrobiota bacterium]
MPYHVYVIELDPAVAWEVKRFRERNPEMDPGGRCYYVGQSVHEPDCRYRQHRLCHGKNVSFDCICDAGTRPVSKNVSNRYVRKYGMWLKRVLFERHNPLRTRKQAEALEESLALKLQSQGHGVWWG